MCDQIVRAISTDGFVKASAITSKNICERARQIHKTLPTATAALGRVLTACSMMGNLQKVDDGSLTLQIKGGGPLGTLLATSDSIGNVRGYVQHPQVTLMEKFRGKLDVGAAVGTDGMLTVIRDLNLKEPYVGSIELVSGEIAEDVTAYFAQSEQTPTACALGVLIDTNQSVRTAGGYLVQLLPGASDDIIDRIERGVRGGGTVTGMLDEGLDAEALLRRVLPNFELEILETTPVEYRCYCTRERVQSALLSLGREELEDMARSGESAHVECQFCDTDYTFSPAEIRELLDSLEK